MKNKNYIFSADVIRVIAIFGVVFIHTANELYTRLDFFGGFLWWIAILLNAVFRISVPLFIMLSGYFLLGKDESLPVSLKRVISRICIPLLFGVALYMWWDFGMHSVLKLNPILYIHRLFSADVYHLYFLVILIGLYAVAPLFRTFLQTTSTSMHRYFMLFLILIGLSETGLMYVFNGCLTQNFFTMWVPYAGIFVAGFLLGKKAESYSTRTLLILYGLFLAATIGFSYLYYFSATQNLLILAPPGCLSHYFDHFLSLNVLVMTVAAFLLLLQRQFLFLAKSNILSSLVHSVARAAFGIFVLHLFIARLLEMQFRMAIDFTPLPLALYVPLKLFLTFFLAYLITLLLSKIPYLRRLVGYSQ